MPDKDPWIMFGVKTKDHLNWRFDEMTVTPEVFKTFNIESYGHCEQLEEILKKSFPNLVECRMTGTDEHRQSKDSWEFGLMSMSLTGWTKDLLTGEMIAPDELPSRPNVEVKPAKLNFTINPKSIWSLISIDIVVAEAHLYEGKIKKLGKDKLLLKTIMWCSAAFNPFEDLQIFIRNIENGLPSKWHIDEEGTYTTFCIWHLDNNTVQLRLMLEGRKNNKHRPTDESCDVHLDKAEAIKQFKILEEYFINNGHWTAENVFDYF